MKYSFTLLTLAGGALATYGGGWGDYGYGG
jgi:hypothetical protein